MKKHENYERNPFVRDLTINHKSELYKIADSDTKLVSGEKEIADVNVVFAAEKLRERAKFIKIYGNDVSFLLKLKRNGLIMFVYLCSRLRVNRDTVLLDMDEAVLKYEITLRNAKEGVENLLDNEIIAKTMLNNQYYINPKIMYRGERRFLLNPDNHY